MSNAVVIPGLSLLPFCFLDAFKTNLILRSRAAASRRMGASLSALRAVQTTLNKSDVAGKLPSSGVTLIRPPVVVTVGFQSL